MSSYNAGIYDFYDDNGALLRRVVEGSDDVPDFVKTAQQVGHDGHRQLYALVMVDEGVAMQKFATADAGNTWLSTLYFSLTKDHLPPEAQKVAAANLIEACEHFDIDAPELLWDYADGPVETNLVDVSGTTPRTKVAHAPREDVHYAIERADGSTHYPLRDAAEVKTAMDYFERNAGDFVPRERREFAVKVAAQAARGALPLTEKVAAYSGDGWNPAVEGHLTQRYVFLRDAGRPMPARTQLYKLASVRKAFNPEDFAEALEVFDREFGLDALWDRDIADPWFSVTGDYPDTFEKKASASFTVGEITVTGDELARLAQDGSESLGQNFGQEFANHFQASPVEVFESMPAPQRRFLARMATGLSDEGGQD